MLVQAFSIFVMLAILSILIIVHECGHFSVARFFGFQTPVFGFGLPFGPHWVVGKKWGTEFRIHACLLGGYVAIPELGDESNQDAFGLPLQPFRKFPIWQRALVAFAGVGFNMLFAYLVMLVMLVSIGDPVTKVMVQSLPPDIPIAAKAGIKPGDNVTSIDNVKIDSTDDAIKYLVSHKEAKVTVGVLRDKQPMSFDMTTNADGRVGMGLATVGTGTYRQVQGNIVEVAGLAFKQLWNLTSTMLDALGQMFQGLFKVGKGASGAHPAVEFKDLHGVLAVIAIGSDIVKSDWRQAFLFTIMISMDLAIINLVPWPALDGGHLAFMFFEAVRGRPMGERAQGEIVKWGFLSLIVLMVVIMFNDVTALVSGKLAIGKSAEKETTETKTDSSTGTTTTTGTSTAAPEGASPAGSSAPESTAAPDKASQAPEESTQKGSQPSNMEPAPAH